MGRVAIIVAMERELTLLSSLVEDRHEEIVGGGSYLLGRIGSREVVVVQSGIGKVSAATAALELILQYSPTTIISSGVAGGIDPSLRVMDLVISSECCYHDVWCGEPNEMGQVQGLPARFISDQELYEKSLKLHSEVRIVGGLICTGDQFITDRDSLNTIKSNFAEALAVDMESAAIAQVCHMRGVNFLSCRIISDTPSSTNDHSQQYNNFWDLAPQKTIEVVREIITLAL